ncbi:hypothetical protein HK096_008800, partial [Nowakowskiella sp. JEL0078]
MVKVPISPINEIGTPPSQLVEDTKNAIRMFANFAALKYSMNQSGVLEETLDEDTLNSANDILQKIREHIKKMDELQKETVPHVKELLNLRQDIALLSSDYFRLVPSKDFKDRGLQPIMNFDSLNQQLVKIANLKYIDSASTMFLAAAHNRTKINPLDYIYASLQCSIVPIEIGEPEETLIRRTVKTTQNGVDLDVVSILKVNRKGERETFERHANLENHRILWHGTSLSNFMGIFTSGLRVAPIDSQATGYMFGKGIYFADMFTKSYGYTGYDESHVCLLLCEVALGKMWESKTAEYMESAKPETHSTKGLGISEPVNNAVFNENGAKLSIGPIKQYQNETSLFSSGRTLAMNEYVVYDPTQVKIRYVVIVRNPKNCSLCGKNSSTKPGLEYASIFPLKKLKLLVELNGFEIEIINILFDKLSTNARDIYQKKFVKRVVEEKLYESRWNPPMRLKED